MTQLGVVGSPISHSLSPVLHRAAYAALGLDWNYEKYEVIESEFSQFVESLSPDFTGLSVTMPDKEVAYSLASVRDRYSALTKSANTLLFARDDSGRSITAFNTDIFGMTQTFTDFGVKSAETCVIFGSGATAASAVVAASELSVRRLFIVSRNLISSRGIQKLADSLSIETTSFPIEELRQVPCSDIAICTMPSDAQLNLDGSVCAQGSLFLDTAYNPWPTPRALSWELSGGRAISGLHMLARQALRQVRIFVYGDPEMELVNEKHIFDEMCRSVNLEIVQ